MNRMVTFSGLGRYALRVLWITLISFLGMGMFLIDYGLDNPEPVGKFLDGNLPDNTPGGVTGWDVEPAFPNVTFNNPMYVVPQPTTDQLIVGQRDGVIWRITDDQNTSGKTLFLDLSNTTAVVWDGGMLGLAFHPEFGQNGSPNKNYVYIYYCARPPGASFPPGFTNGFFGTYLRLSRFEVNAATNVVDPASELQMINIRLYNGSHRGGGMVFGPDDYLWLTIGDQFRYTTAQDLAGVFEGGVIRIDVDQNSSRSHAPRRRMQDGIAQSDEFTGIGYGIPNDNPYLDTNGGLFEEFYTLGHRAPHRMTYDAPTQRFWIGEIGGGQREEINVIRFETDKGSNYGWPFREGTINGPRAEPATYYGELKEPTIDFLRSEANAIIGGYVYRGSEFPSLNGRYITGGYSQKRIWAMTYDPSTGLSTKEYLCQFTPGLLSSFGIGHDNELYLCGLGDNKNLYKLKALGLAAQAPALLSQTGAFSSLEPLEASPRLIPYDLNVPFWSDGAEKFRWMAIPNDGTHNTADEQIVFSENGEWTFPNGTVFVKHFELEVDENNGTKKKLETRFLVHGDNGQYYGLTYKWRDNGLEADLLATGLDETITIQTANGSREQVWHYPSRSECATCHLPQAGHILGPKTRQLNRDQYYPVTGRTANQLSTLNNLGMFSNPINENDIPNFLTSTPTHSNASLQDRARSYIDANCASCHRPGTGNRAVFDARLSTDFALQGFINGAVIEDLNIPGAKIVVPQDPSRSMLYVRSASLDDGVAMPPLAKNLVDDPGMQVLFDWINSLSQNSVQNGTNAVYFDNMNLTGNTVTRIDNEINFNWGSGSPDPAIGADTYSARWTGYVVPPETGTYTFYTTSDDGIRLWIDDQLIVDKWIDQGPTEWSGTIVLTEGVAYDLRMEYYENGGGAVAELRWAGPSFTKEIIPYSRLFIVPPGINPPVVTNPGDQQNNLGEAISLQINANDPDGFGVTFAASDLPPGLTMNSSNGLISGIVESVGGYSVTLTVSDNQSSVNTSFNWEVLPSADGRGYALREVWTGIPGSLLSDLTNNASYPDSPTIVDSLASFEGPVNWANEYGTRVRAFLYAPVSGNYTFWISTDDQGSLLLSSDADPANAASIASVPSWSASRQWEKFPDQQSAQIALQAGERYYIELLQKEGGGGDNLAVAWQYPGQSRMVIPGLYLSPYRENLPPVVSNPGAQITSVGQEVSLQITATDPDGDGLTYSAANLPAGLAIDAAGGLISGTPSVEEIVDVTVTVSDGHSSVNVLFDWTVEPFNACAGLIREAEDAILSGRFEIGTDPSASGGAYVHTPDGSGDEYGGISPDDYAEFCFTVAEEGTYEIHGWIYAAGGDNNSFFVTVDGLPTTGYLWDTSENTGYEEDLVADRDGPDPVQLMLTPGNHTVRLYLREEGTRIDKLELVAVNSNPSCAGLLQQAEDGMLFGDFVIGSDAVAGGGAYVHVPNGAGNSWNPDPQHRVDFCMEVPIAGTYQIRTRVYADGGGDNSFYVKVNGAPSEGFLWDAAHNTSYENDYVSDRGGMDPVQIQLPAGNHLVSVFLREDGTRLDEIELELIGAGAVCGGLVQEAESATLFGRMTVGTDANAGGGEFIHAPEGSGTNGSLDADDRAEFCFSVPTTGSYYLRGTVYADDGQSNSFYVTMDGNPSKGYLWDFDENGSYENDLVSDRDGADPVEWVLSAGDHFVNVYVREDGARLDKLELVSTSVNRVAADSSGGGVNGQVAIPEAFALHPNYPNPFNPETTIEYELPQDETVSITIYNIQGQKVLQLENGVKRAGYHQVRWNGANENGQKVSSGIYLLVFESASVRKVQKMVLSK